ncbi:RNA polymerase sigma factor [Sphingobacterium sp. lm-10]|uniref:RNA polymerase sigma factor n=1 Tax=Sphingobacterium sp. lm-10 TaxID=2944904 RepID=UPI002020B1BA|nr:RNA polymerase sigma factor [Sphingobacterium sp. lm-10]
MKAGWTDKELIDLCLAGKDSGYTWLYERYATSIYNSIYRLVNNMAEAEDLLQEVFVNVFSNVNRLVELDSFEAWTKRIAINKSISHLRKRRVYFTDIDSIKGGEIPQIEEDNAWQQSRVEDIEKAIEQLPDTARTIVNLFLFEDMSQEEIGEIVGLSHTAVRSQYHRAKSKIAQMIKEKGCYGR